MRILLYNPDNGVTRNFMPHLWMFLLQSLTPKGHEVLLIDGNTQPLDEAGIAQYVIEQHIGLVGIGAMTRMIAKEYRMADAIRSVGVPVVMGGPHVTEEADEALGRDGGPRHADAVALGEADETWPRIVNDAAQGQLKDVYAPVHADGKQKKPSLKEYPAIPWNSIDLDQFNLVPKLFKAMLDHVGEGWGTFRVVPVESGRGCPYGCEFCTVTGFFGDSIRFRSNESVVNELLMLKAHARREKGRSRFSSSTTTSPSTSNERSHYFATLSPPKRKCIGWLRSAPICCATRNWWVLSLPLVANGYSSAWSRSTQPTSEI